MTGSPTAPAGLGWPWSLGSALLPDGRVFVLGGSTAQLYDPVAGAFAPTVSPIVRSQPTVTLLDDGTVLITGGSQPVGDTPGQALASAALFRP